MKALLALEDGTVFYGDTFAGEGEVSGEVVFNTGMTGYQEILYQEILPDPSYKGQVVTMTCPLIGNYGINSMDIESSKALLDCIQSYLSGHDKLLSLFLPFVRLF